MTEKGPHTFDFPKIHSMILFIFYNSRYRGQDCSRQAAVFYLEPP